jgi:thiol-disulfide isomerase/thioredoxin
MIRLAAVLVAACFLCAAQSAKEQEDLNRALDEAGSSPAEYLRAIDKHLQQYPNSARRPELERAAVLSAIEAHDDARLISYGERVLAREPSDLQTLSAVTPGLLASGSRATSERALTYARRYEELARQMQRDRQRSGMREADWKQQTDRAIGRALAWEARANGNLGRPDEALALAQRAFETDPTAESAREIARWYERLGKNEEAARALADAFTIPDPHNSESARSLDRVHMGELYRKAKGSEAGLGGLVLESYDRNVALIHSRELALRAADPNAQLTDPMAFTLSAPDGAKLRLADLKGKVVVFDFWATWCGPCRVQHPLYEEVKQRFHDKSDVVFLSVNTDQDRALVKPFLADVNWNGPVYFEDGLSRTLRVTSIPTTLVVGRDGKIFSRMNGFDPKRFVDILTSKIRDAL